MFNAKGVTKGVTNQSAHRTHREHPEQTTLLSGDASASQGRSVALVFAYQSQLEVLAQSIDGFQPQPTLTMEEHESPGYQVTAPNPRSFETLFRRVSGGVPMLFRC